MRHTGGVRIALVHYSCLPTIAGVEAVMAEQARLLSADGHTVTIIASTETDEATPDGVHSLADLGTRSPLALRVQRELDTGGLGVAFEQAVEQLAAQLFPVFAAQDTVILHNVATMHFHLALTAAVWRLADELPRVRFIGWIHDLAACNPDYAPLPLDREPWALLARAHPRFTYVAVSELRRTQFLTLTAQPPERCRTIPNGVDPVRLLDLSPRIEEVARRFRLFERGLVLLHPARLLRRKNVELTLHVVAALKAAGTSCAALITAPPEVHSGTSAAYENEIRTLHEDLGLHDDVLFLADEGPLDPPAMRELFDLADALFFPSRQEGFGLPVLEAALHRLPVFCSDIEPLRSLLPEATTFPLEAAPAEIAHLIGQRLAADDARHARRHTLRHYSWSGIYGNLLSPLLAETEPR